MILPRHLSTVFSPRRPENRGGLVGWWPFADGAAQDVSGNNNYGTLSGTPPPRLVRGIVPDAGNVGYGLLFDGANSYVNVPNFNSLGMTTATVAFWIWHVSAAGNPRPIANGHTDADNSGFQFITGSTFTAQFGNGSTQGGFNTGVAFVAGRWYHVAATIDFPNNKIVGYVNAVSAATSTVPTGTNQFLSAGTAALGFGRNNVYLGDYLSGYLDDVRIYNKALTGGEVADLYLSGLSAKIDETEMSAIAVISGGGVTDAVGTSGGSSTVSGVGASIALSTGTSGGSSTVAGTALVLIPSAGTSGGSSTVSGVSISLSASTGTSGGIATSSGVGAALALSVGTSGGSATVAGVASPLDNAVGTAGGSCTVSGVSPGGGISDAVGTSGGSSTVAGIGASLSISIGTSGGISTSSGVSASLAISTGTSGGLATVSGIGASLFASVGTSGGSCSVAGIGTTGGWVGTSGGSSTVVGVSASIAVSKGTAGGSCTIIGIAGGVAATGGGRYITESEVEHSFDTVWRYKEGLNALYKHMAAVNLGRAGGLKGGPARAASMTQAQRSQSASNAAVQRWKPR